MTKIRYKNQLPSWFNASRYLFIKTKATNEQLDYELTLRRCINIQLNNGEIGTGEQEELFQEYVFEEPQAPCTDDYDDRFETIYVGNIELIAEEIHRQANNLINVECYSQDNWFNKSQEHWFNKEHWRTPLHLLEDPVWLGGNADVLGGINLRNTTDKELIAAFQKWLPKIRKEMGIPEPKRFRFDEKIELVFSCGVLEYLDLTLWARSRNTTISNKLLATVILNGKFTEKEISNKVRKHAYDAISSKFLMQLSHFIKDAL
ncbi:DUF6387 family protein [Agarivorans sp. Z349TD_8]|uniref:DUF6387 family protein n=1 Tax=Agarivorans sp. Z349TD_8 TaxID=3421434 RepID=UPI003D7D56A8